MSQAKGSHQDNFRTIRTTSGKSGQLLDNQDHLRTTRTISYTSSQRSPVISSSPSEMAVSGKSSRRKSGNLLDFRRERLPRDAGVGRRPEEEAEEEAGVEPEVEVAEEVDGTVKADLDVEDFSSAGNKEIRKFLRPRFNCIWSVKFVIVHLLSDLIILY